MESDTRRMRAAPGLAVGVKPFEMTNLRTQHGLSQVIAFIEQRGMLSTAAG